MASSSRGPQFAKVHKVLKKQSYEVVLPDVERPLLEHLLFSACLEDARYDAAEQAFAALSHNFFDWNEIRVSTIRELAEVMPGLPDPAAAANRVKRILHSVFESTYSFDLEDLRKKNLGPAIEQLKALDGTTSFTVAYVVQSALGGHAIPIDAGALEVFQILNLVTDKNIKDREVPGLERAIIKSKGLEFGSLLHQLGADLVASPYSPAVRDILLQIDPGSRARLPKRLSRKKKTQPEKTKATKEKTVKREQGKAKSAAETKKKPKTKDAQSRTGKGKSSKHKEKETSSQTGGSQEKSKPAAKKTADRTAGKKKSTTSGLSKKKPR